MGVGTSSRSKSSTHISSLQQTLSFMKRHNRYNNVSNANNITRQDARSASTTPTNRSEEESGVGSCDQVSGVAIREDICDIMNNNNNMIGVGEEDGVEEVLTSSEAQTTLRSTPESFRRPEDPRFDNAQSEDSDLRRADSVSSDLNTSISISSDMNNCSMSSVNSEVFLGGSNASLSNGGVHKALQGLSIARTASPRNYFGLTPSPKPGPDHAMALQRQEGVYEGRQGYDETLTRIKTEIKTATDLLTSVRTFTNEASQVALENINRSYYTVLELDTEAVNEIGYYMTELDWGRVFMTIWESLNPSDLYHQSQFKSDPMLILNKIKTITWNFSDKSRPFCRHLCERGLVGLLKVDLSHSELQSDKLSHDMRRYMVKGDLGILHNLIRYCPANRLSFRRDKGIALFQKFLQSSYLIVKTTSLMILAYVIDQEENDILNATPINIKFIIDMLSDALSRDSHVSRRYMFTAMEIVQGLNQLAANDNNKVMMVDQGALPLLVDMLSSSSSVDSAKVEAAKAIWQLSFVEENKPKLRNNEECVRYLREYKKEAGKELAEACSGVLFELYGKEELLSRQPSIEVDSSIPHVMISYQWTYQALVAKLKDRLKAAGFKVWMDIERMAEYPDGDILDAMAEAVENSCIVVVCVSSSYQYSPPCRTEAKYAYRLRKPIIPVLVENGFIPKGWLGALVGTNLFHKCYTEQHLDTEIQLLVQALGDKGRLERSMSEYDGRVVCSHTPRSPARRCDSDLSTPVTSWTTSDVVRWLRHNDLSDVAENFRQFNGDLLIEMCRLSKYAPEFFFNSLRTDLGFDNIVLILRFSAALNKLPAD